MEKISIKQKLLDTISAHPKLMIYGVSLAITFAVSLVVGSADHSHMAYARVKPVEGWK